MAVAAAGARPYDHAFFGHPRGLSTLFFTEMWERFSYYGMRAFLILYMVHALNFDDKHAGAIYGTYTGSVWLAAIFGGIIADRWLGHYRSVLVGGIKRLRTNDGVSLEHGDTERFLRVIAEAFLEIVGRHAPLGVRKRAPARACRAGCAL